jgi:hypothetical protein
MFAGSPATGTTGAGRPRGPFYPTGRRTALAACRHHIPARRTRYRKLSCCTPAGVVAGRREWSCRRRRTCRSRCHHKGLPQDCYRNLLRRRRSRSCRGRSNSERSRSRTGGSASGYPGRSHPAEPEGWPVPATESTAEAHRRCNLHPPRHRPQGPPPNRRLPRHTLPEVLSLSPPFGLGESCKSRCRILKNRDGSQSNVESPR